MPRVIYERKEGEPLPDHYIDGMESVIDEYDFQPTEYTISENPPFGLWLGTHTRDGRRVTGWSEEEYIRGERTGTVQRDQTGRPIYAEST